MKQALILAAWKLFGRALAQRALQLTIDELKKLEAGVTK